MKKNPTHFRDGAVVLYKRGRSNKWQARIKIGKGKNSWKRIATGSSDIKELTGQCEGKYHAASLPQEQTHIHLLVSSSFYQSPLS